MFISKYIEYIIIDQKFKLLVYLYTDRETNMIFFNQIKFKLRTKMTSDSVTHEFFSQKTFKRVLAVVNNQLVIWITRYRDIRNNNNIKLSDGFVREKY